MKRILFGFILGVAGVLCLQGCGDPQTVNETAYSAEIAALQAHDPDAKRGDVEVLVDVDAAGRVIMRIVRKDGSPVRCYQTRYMPYGMGIRFQSTSCGIH